MEVVKLAAAIVIAMTVANARLMDALQPDCEDKMKYGMQIAALCDGRF